ncbi:polysaccharide deacetylase family protein [Sporosarcina sp. 179-K 3D1 HS]|uniref:polysaccharide deacetylase family protein n=1 Tax=Sporosarcina sp. 179-K 3D1 HS TaxID=3232169 RepID=UPI0039A2D560
MKKGLTAMLSFFLLAVAACSDEETAGNPAEPEPVKTEEVKMVETSSDEPAEEAEEDIAEETIGEPLYGMNPNTFSLEPIVDADPQVVLLTIDDAPDKRALDMAKTLKGLNAPAIFFVNGHFIDTEEKRAVLKEIHDLGFVIGNHTQTHANLKKLSEEEQRQEILSVSDTVEEIVGERPKFFRAPFGANTEFSKKIAEEDGMLVMNWSYGYDFEKEYMTREKIAHIMVNTELLRNGSNLLMHDREWTADALEEIVLGLREKGYTLVDPLTIKGVEQRGKEEDGGK